MTTAKNMFDLAQGIAKEARASESKLKERRLASVMPYIKEAAGHGKMHVRISMSPDRLTEQVLTENGFKVAQGSSYDPRDGTGSHWLNVSWEHYDKPTPRGA